jgi:nucleoside-diphosphate-sugar epimerase
MIFVLGCDGYIGNALTQKLLAEGNEVIGFDNFWRRDWVREEMGSMSATPLLDMEEKSALFSEMYRGTFSFEEMDIEADSDILKNMLLSLTRLN